MKTKTLSKIAIFLLIPGIMSISSCGKKKLENSTTTAQDNATSEALYDDIYNNASSANSDYDDTVTSKTGSAFKAFTDPCAVITYIADTTNSGQWYVKSLTIDYGTGCVWKGRTRKGKIHITRNGKWFTVGTSTIITLENFSIDGYAVEGTNTITPKTATPLQFVTSPWVTASFDVVVTEPFLWQ